MAVYSYQGRDEATGELVTGVREQSSHAELGQALLQEGILLTRFNIKKQGKSKLFGSIFGGAPLIEKVLFARYFGVMLKAGLDAKQALIALAQQTKGQAMKTAVEGVLEAINKGTTLADGMIAFPKIYSPIFISFIRVGEATGRLQESLEILALQLQKEYELRRAVRGALLYPVVILTALVAVGFAMLVFVVPRLAEVFEGFDVELPLATRVLIAVGSFFEVYWWLVLILLVLASIGGYFLWRIKKVRGYFMYGILFVPIIGSIVQQVNLARFTRNLSSLLSSGVSFIDALDLLAENTPHGSYAAVFRGAEDHVKQGRLLSEFLGESPRLFPPLVINVIKVGEETGALDSVLTEIATFYEGEIDQVMKNLTSILEPVLMVVIGLAVGALAVSVISPIYNLVNVI